MKRMENIFEGNGYVYFSRNMFIGQVMTYLPILINFPDNAFLWRITVSHEIGPNLKTPTVDQSISGKGKFACYFPMREHTKSSSSLMDIILKKL